MKLIAVHFLLCLPILLSSQNCDCATDFIWVKSTFENNDAGFSYILEKKGKSAYQAHNSLFSEKVKTIKDRNKCNETLYDWLTFFRSGHISIKPINHQEESTAGKKLSDAEISAKYKDSKRIEVDISAFTKYLELTKKMDYEGIWESGSYKIGVKKVDNEYLGFIIEADGVYWKKGQVKFIIKPDNTSIYYMRDHSERKFKDTKLIDNIYLKVGLINLKRVIPGYSDNPRIEQYFRAITAEKPYFTALNDVTTYLRIPTFAGYEKSKIDSVIRANKEQILQTPNLIIDIRNNGGGSDRSYNELLSILYTNPIRTVGMEMFSTALNNQRMLDFVDRPEDWGLDEETVQWAKKSFEILSEEIGNFVNLDTTVVEITSFDTIYPYPKNVGIIINEKNGSTSEQFLLAAKQSKKVKLFGTTTFGVLDISNMHFVNSPCEEFKLGYSLSKSLRIPEMTIDGKGIQPDYYLDKSIPAYDWIDVVAKYLDGK